ncbi:Glycerol-1-phosphate dehydrogenase [NAD(P)+] [Planctopirus ephydatiae]|uniref:Glycerol-1-phosphate dehydrogenase [NAD(P)+] n=1 Tax=Planctopirus ephydatiae TaxID=2528019 RepID=A0A518GPA3_9PLAN|nr:iron-containing alcohol dehydrogenase family protein [Planctopirus ephydatiae]QDV30453.1 Glycerol-1-phosphate dehydrogenase [NAD(P)+] [Planctopirus ephydatiae]
MLVPTISLPALLRIKPGAMSRLGIYLTREKFQEIALFSSTGMQASILEEVARSLEAEDVAIRDREEVADSTIENALRLLGRLPADVQAVVGVGGGKALDVAKFVAHLANRPYIAVPTSLSNDGFCSPQASLTLDGHRKSIGARLPFGVVVDTQVCLEAPRSLWLSGIGDLIAKFTAVYEWKASFHARGEPVNDLAALLSDATVRQFLSRPTHDLEGIRLLATALMLGGISMEISGTSRPASGSEHLISHALDEISSRPRLHGVQVGMATYLMSTIIGQHTEEIRKLLTETGFLDLVREDPFDGEEWRAAIQKAPSIKPHYFSLLNTPGNQEKLLSTMRDDPTLVGCFR